MEKKETKAVKKSPEKGKDVKKMTKNYLFWFNEFWAGWKVTGLSSAGIRDYFHLKEKIAKQIQSVQEELTNVRKETVKGMGYGEGAEIPEDKQAEIDKIVDDIAEKIGNEEVDIDTHILSEDDLFNGMLNISENASYTTQDKYIMMSILKKV